MIIKSKKLSQFKNIKHGTSTRASGAFSFKKNPDSNKVIIDRTKFVSSIGVKANETVLMGEQYHTGNVEVVTHKDIAKGMFDKHTAIPETDAMITNVVGMNLVVYTADCLPVLLYDPEEGVIGVAHAGWRGIVKSIIPNAIGAMKKDFGSDPADIIAYIGPCLCVDHFEVHNDVAEKFLFLFSDNENIVIPLNKSDEKGKKFSINLREAAKQQLLDQGIKENNIEIDKHCTWEDGNLYSARKDGITGDNNWSIIGMTE